MSFGKLYKWFGGICLTGGSDHIEFLQKKNPGGNSLIIRRQCSNVLLFEGLIEVYTVPVFKDLIIQRERWGKHSNASHSQGRMTVLQFFLRTVLPISHESTLLLEVCQWPTSPPMRPTLPSRLLCGVSHCPEIYISNSVFSWELQSWEHQILHLSIAKVIQHPWPKSTLCLQTHFPILSLLLSSHSL